MKRFIKIMCSFLSGVLLISMLSVYSFAAHVYQDISEDDWFYDDVMYLYDRLDGDKKFFSDNVFSPNEEFSRAMVIVMLYNFEGKPSPEIAPDDTWAVKYAGKYFADACVWAKQEGLAEGYDDGEFHPDNKITREEFVTFMVRYAEYKGYDISDKATISQFVDADTVSTWAMDSMIKSVSSGLIRGRSNTELAPQKNVTRAEVVVVIRRFIDMVNK